MEIFPNQSLFLGIFPKMCPRRSKNCSILCQNEKTTPAWGGLENHNHNILIFPGSLRFGAKWGKFPPDRARSRKISAFSRPIARIIFGF